MDFAHSEKTETLIARLTAFFEDHVLPRNAQWVKEAAAHAYPISFMSDLKALAKSEGLWNLFLPHLREDEPGTRLTNLEFAPLAEVMGKLPWAPEVFNCSAPDTGNMELLHMFATPKQQERWLKPLLEGEIRSCFAMTEPDVVLRRDEHYDVHSPRRRGIRHQWTQVVHQRRRQSGLQTRNRDGKDGPQC
jgi:acyl-CoA dehydrogenase